MENEQAEPRIYEVGYHILPLVPEEKLASIVGELKSVLEGNKAVVISEDYPKLRSLAYTIRKFVGGRYQKFNQGFFGWIKFEMDPEVISAVKKAFEGNENILRFLVIKTVRENTMAPKAIFQPKETKLTAPKEEKKKDPAEPAISEEELDKTIDELVVE